MRTLTLIFNMLLFLGWGTLSSIHADALHEKISVLKSVKALPDFISWSYSFKELNGKIQIRYPILSKKEESEYKVKTSSLAKQTEKMKKEINQLLSKEKFQVQWAEHKDKVKIKEQEFEGVILECSFTKIRKVSDIKADIEAEKKRILAEKAEYDKKKEEWQKKAQAQQKAWEEFQKAPYLFNFNAKLAGSSFIHTEKIDEISFLGIKVQEAKKIVRSLTFLSETEVKYQEGENFQVYDIIKRGPAGLELQRKNSDGKATIECWSENVFIFERNIFTKTDYKPSLKLSGKSFSTYNEILSFIKSYGVDNILLPWQEKYGQDTYLEYNFLPTGKIKVSTYRWELGQTNFDPSDREEQYRQELVQKMNLDSPLEELDKDVNYRLSDNYRSRFNSKKEWETELFTFLEEALQKYAQIKFEFKAPYFTVSEDEQSYTWEQKKGNLIILKNIYSSSDNKYFVYTHDFRLLGTDDRSRPVDHYPDLYLVK